MKKMQHRFNENGSVIFETVMTICILFFILFAFLQIYHWSVEKMYCQYAAFYASKSMALGYKPNLAMRAARVAAIGISGRNIGKKYEDVKTEAEHYMIYGDGSAVRYQRWFPEHNGAPHLVLHGNYRNQGVYSEIRMKNGNLLHESFNAIFNLKHNFEPAAIVDSYNYSSEYLEE